MFGSDSTINLPEIVLGVWSLFVRTYLQLDSMSTGLVGFKLTNAQQKALDLADLTRRAKKRAFALNYD